MPMKVAVACGGTGGHVFPGLAVAKALRKRGHRVSLWVGGRDVEGVSLGNWDGPVTRIVCSGFPDGLSWRALKTTFVLLKAFWVCRRIMRRDRPDAVVGMGGYASVGPACAAKSLGIPVILHEANAVPGRAISFLSRLAHAVAVSFGGTAEHLRGARTVLTGFPVRDDLNGARLGQPLAPGTFTVLVTGGSQGAHKLNEVVSSALCALRARGESLQVVHLTGSADESLVREKYASAGVPHVVRAFLEDMGRAYHSADLAITRAGAGTCAELAACGVPALLVPLPSARRNHQMANAQDLMAKGGADVIGEKALTSEWLADYVHAALTNPGKLAGMKKALGSLPAAGAAERIADLVEESARVAGPGEHP